MKINASVGKEFEPEFKNVKCGDVFRYKGALFMKIWWPNNVFMGVVRPEEGTHTAVHLGTGGLIAVSIDERVKRINGEFRY